MEKTDRPKGKRGPKPSGIKRETFSFRLRTDVAEMMRTCVFWSHGSSLTQFLETAILAEAARLERERGGPFPQRGALHQGRPVRAARA
jgi:hypothetical protein